MDRYVPLPPLPPRLSRLNELAYDLWWSWNPEAREVFRDLDYPLWRFTDHNPVLLLHLIESDRLAHAADDATFLQMYDRAVAGLDAVRAGTGTWWAQRTAGAAQVVALITPSVSAAVKRLSFELAMSDHVPPICLPSALGVRSMWVTGLPL